MRLYGYLINVWKRVRVSYHSYNSHLYVFGLPAAVTLPLLAIATSSYRRETTPLGHD